MQSKRRVGTRGRDELVVEIDPAFAKNVGLTEGSKVEIGLHAEPPVATTVHIEPLTVADWEVIELHASFLEMNLLSQLRALTSSHPLTIYLTPTSTASVKLTKLEPEDAYLNSAISGADFAKLSPEAEVVVAPKKREKKKAPSVSKRSVAGTVRTGRKSKGEPRSASTAAKKQYFRAVTLPYQIGPDADEEEESDEMKEGGRGYAVYVDPEVAESPMFLDNPYATVTIIRPPGLATGQDLQQQQAQNQDPDGAAEQIEPSKKVVARVSTWNTAPDNHHVALSRVLANALDVNDEIGVVVRLEPAPAQVPLPKVPKVKIYPFTTSNQEKDAAGIRWGGSKTKSADKEKEEALRKLKDLLTIGFKPGTKKADQKPQPGAGLGFGVLDGPLTDGMVLPPIPDSALFSGGILKLDIPDMRSKPIPWIMTQSAKLTVSIEAEIIRPNTATTLNLRPPSPPPSLVAIEKTLDGIRQGLLSRSSVLVTGAHLSGKTNVLSLITQEFSSAPYFYKIIRPPPLVKFSDERIGTIKENLNKWLSEARWGAGTRGAIVVLDDLDRVCVPEQEGMDTARARQVAETFVAVVRKGLEGGNVFLLASAVGKDSLHSWVVGGKIFRDVVNIANLDREARRKVLEKITAQPGLQLDPSLDLVEVAGKTDGYTPGDLHALVGRARHTSLIRTLTSTSTNSPPLQTADFTTALEGFLPASLRGVKLQTSGASWEDIGGLTETRQTLLETLEYPTKYAPIFNKSPLRLRSGLLLYGYPGCGKTLLASAIASQCGLNFISVKGPEILNKYIGSSEKSVRDLFERAQAAKPCVLFFDEFDSIAPKRGHDSTGVTDRVVNQMLTQMDGAEGLEGVYVLAATSRPDLIDPALLRPGRLDKSLLCDMPDASERLSILRALARKLHVASDVDFDELAKRTEGFSGADLQAVLYNAHLEAVHEVIARGEEEMAAGKKKKRGAEEEERELEFLQFVMEGGSGLDARERAQVLAKVSCSG